MTDRNLRLDFKLTPVGRLRVMAAVLAAQAIDYAWIPPNVGRVVARALRRRDVVYRINRGPWQRVDEHEPEQILLPLEDPVGRPPQPSALDPNPFD